jgi:hypothetical protein
VGEGELRVVGDDVGVGDDVDVQGAGAPAFLPDAVEGLLDGWTPQGSVSYTGDTAFTRTPGVSSRASTAPWRVSRRLPRLEPREITARWGLCRVVSAASTFSTTEAGTGWTVGSR